MASRMRRVWGRGKAPKQQQQPQQPRPPSQRGGFISSAISLLPFGGGGGGHPPPSRTTTPVPTSTIRSSERGSGLFAAALSLTPFGGSSGAGAAAAAAIARASLAASLGEASGAGGHVAGGAEEDARAGDSGAGEGGELDAAAAAEQEMRDWYQGGPNGPAAKLAKLPPQYWGELHVPGTAAPFKVRGASYLADRLKVDAGVPQFVLAAVDLVAVDGPTQHISRFLPSVRENPAAFSFVVNLIIPGTPILSLVSVFINEHHPSILGERPEPGTSDCDWQPFDFALHRFLNGTDAERTSMLKLIPHLPNASWVIKQSVGTVPVILGNKLKTTFYRTDRYIEATVDVTSTNAAAYITGMVRGATKSLIIDLGYVLEGQTEEELPEVLLGAFRLSYMDIGEAQYLDTSKELPMPEARPAPPSPVKRPGQPAAPGASMVAARVSMDGGREEQQRRQQQQQQQQGEVEACGGVSEGEAGPKTMTSHARNRSNTSVEELLGPSAGVLTAKQQQQQQQQQQARAGVPTADGPSHHSAALRSQQPSRGSTYEGQPVAAAAAAAAAGGDAGSSAHGSRRPSSGGAGGLLGTSPRGGGAAAAAAPAAAPPTLRPLGSVPLAVGAAASPSVPGSGGAAPPGGHRRTISDFVPRSAAAAFAGVLGGPGGSAPLSASPSLACARQSSDGQAAPAAAATTAAAAGKLSAADYITRAHAVAMATSAQRRGSAGGGRGGGATAAGGPLQAAASGPLAGASPVPQLAPSASTPAPAAVGSKAPAASAGKERRSGLPGIPQASWSADGEATVGPAGGAAAGKGGWRHKRNASGVA